MSGSSVQHAILFVIFALVSANDGEVNGEDAVQSIPAKVTVTSWNDMPFSGIAKENGTFVGKGYAFYLLDLISAKLNFSYTIVPPSEHVLGDERNGILGLLHQKKVDMAVAFLPVLPEMRRFCSFSTALDETRLTALMQRPQESATGSGLLAPFDRTVWILVLTALICVGPVIYLFALVRAKLWNDPDSENYSLPSCVWFVYSSLLKQGTNIVATTDSTRMLFATWWIFILILTSFYTANLTAFLTKPQFTLSINSLKDIVTGGYSWITYRGRTIDFLLSQPNVNELSSLNATRRKGRGIFKYTEPTTAILHSISKKRLFLAESHYLQTLIFEDYVNKTRRHLEHGSRCKYVIMPGSVLVSNRAFAFPLDSPIRRPMNIELMKLVETGIIQHTKEKDLPLAEICPVDLRSTERQLRNADLVLTYKVVAAGYVIGLLAFFLELSAAYANRKKLCGRGRHGEARFSMSASKSKSTVSTEHAMHGKMHRINGRSYYVLVGKNGDQRLIPVRTPSAFLFQYTA